jgi:hypothetical protein
MSALRIAYVINSVEGGGAAQPVPAVASVLREAGAEVRVFALTPKDQRGLPAMIDAGLSPLVRQSGTKDHIAAARWMKAELTAWGATHIWTSLSRATILGLLMGPSMGLPVICWQHAAFLKPWNLRLLRALQSRAALWVGDSHSVTQLTAQRLHVEPERLHCWPIFAADPNMPQSQPWKAGEPVKISSLGRLHPVKGYDVLIEALSILQQSSDAPTVPFEITIAGNGDERARLENMAQAANITSVRFAGFTDKPRDLLRDSHLYLQPSRSEGFCIGAHEAMAAGLPVIASAVGELPHSIQDPSMGRVVPPNDAPALAKALASILRNPEALHAAGQQARSTILERFSQEKFRANGRAIVAALQQRSA